MIQLFFAPIFCIFLVLSGCTIEHAEEQVVAYHANGAKKTSIWIYPDGEILKRNEWYSDGIKELEIPYKDSVPHGDFKRWTGFGDLVMEGKYKKGLRHGKWTSYFGGHFNKKTEAIRYYENDHPVGDWTGWHFNGEKAFEEHYSDNGDSIGVWKKWNENGTIAEENSCFSTIDSGFYKKYNFSGVLELQFYCRQGKKSGERLEYYDSGKKVRVREMWAGNILNGVREMYSGEGIVLKREFWRNGLRDSVWQWFDVEGNKIAETVMRDTARTDFGVCGAVVCAESTFVMNEGGEFVLDGTLWFMREGKALRYEENWEHGDIKVSRSFYPDSTADSVSYTSAASEGFWKDGKRDGIWKNWYRNGVLRDSLTYVNGERVGDQFSYDSTGKLTIHKTENGKNRPVIMHIPGVN
ncbi:MAG: hypothetical protein MJZ26_09775 [Fibrobacter sp.]|nr:hypothetical protein [Fibrobacter sp.]